MTNQGGRDTPLKLMFLNCNAWSSGQAVLEHAAGEAELGVPDIVIMAETRLHSGEARGMADRWAASRKLVLHHSGAVATDEAGTGIGPRGGVATSAGVLVGVRADWPSCRVGLQHHRADGRLILVRARVPSWRSEVMLVGIYLWTGEPADSERNAGLLEDLVGELAHWNLPVMILGDWQSEPGHLQATGLA